MTRQIERALLNGRYDWIVVHDSDLDMTKLRHLLV